MTLEPRYPKPKQTLKSPLIPPSLKLVAHLENADFYADPEMHSDVALSFKFCVVTAATEYFFDHTYSFRYRAAINNMSDEDRATVLAIMTTLGTLP